jgi:hypothetical protein
MEQERFPDSSGALTSLLYDIALAGKLIRAAPRAGLPTSQFGRSLAGARSQKRRLRQRTIYNQRLGRLCCMALGRSRISSHPRAYPNSDTCWSSIRSMDRPISISTSR